jgi:hypothetical protein
VRKDWKSKGLPGERGRYDLAEINNWRRERERSKQREHEDAARAAAAQALSSAGDDMDAQDAAMLAAGVSPALERYREERARIAKFQRQQMERDLLPRDAVHQNLARIASLLRGAGEQLQRDCGPEAATILEDALEAATREIEMMFGSPTTVAPVDGESHGDGDAPPKPVRKSAPAGTG